MNHVIIIEHGAPIYDPALWATLGRAVQIREEQAAKRIRPRLSARVSSAHKSRHSRTLRKWG